MKDCYDTGFDDFIEKPKKIIKIKVSFKSRWEIFILKVRLFGVGGYFGVKWKDVKELFQPKELEALFG
jgi:hypothetical protein